MIYQVIAIYDSAVNTFSRPQAYRTTGEAIRDMQNVLAADDKNNNLCTHTEHFSLWDLGTYNDQDGTFNSPPGGHAEKIQDLATLRTKQ